MYTNFDYEEERQNMEDKINHFFGEFSSEIRNKLMSKNLVKPQSLYDVFYPSVRSQLLSKNETPIKQELNEVSEDIREQQLAKAVEKNFSLEEQSEDFRKSLLAREKMHNDNVELLTLFEKKRKDLLSKNISSTTDLMKESELVRRKNISKNVANPNVDKEINEKQESYRQANLSNNSSNNSDLIDDSKNYRRDALSKNDSKETDLEVDSRRFREGDLSANKSKGSSLETGSVQFRKENLSNNDTKEMDIGLYSENFKDKNLSNNVSRTTDLQEESGQFRKNNLSNNDSKNTDLEIDSQRTRKDNLSNNVPGVSDLEKDSIYFRKSDLSYNAPKESNIEKNSKVFREADLSNNNSIKHDLEKESQEFRNGDLSYNKFKKSDLETDSVEFKKENLSNNTPRITDLATDSTNYQKLNLSFNVPKETDLEKDLKGTREGNLSNNVEIKHDLEKESKPYRDGDLSNNVIKDLDLEKDSVPYRDGDLSYNTPVVTDLEKDSQPYRDGDLSYNVSIKTDLEVDSVPYHDANLANNVPSTSDLEVDSVPYHDANLANNVPSTSDLEVDSVPYHDANLANNVPSISDLEVDSVPYHDTNLANNVPGTSDLEVDSVPYHDTNLANNVPSTSNLEVDSVPYHDANLTSNVPSTSDLQTDSTQYHNNNLAANVPGDETIDTHQNQYGQQSSSDGERDFNLSKNVPSHQTIDGHYDEYGSANSAENERIRNLNKNTGMGMLGVNVLGPGGTSLFVGVSGVWTQGLVFRNLLTMRNKYKGQSNYYTEGRNLEYGQGGMLLSNTMKVPSVSDVTEQDALPMNTADIINSSVKNYSNITSPILRNLMMATDNALAYKRILQPYSIYDSEGTVVYNTLNEKIDYNLNNQRITGQNFNFDKSKPEDEKGQKLPENNVNNLIRQYLKYSNPFSLSDTGGLETERPAKTIVTIADQINNLTSPNETGGADYMQTIKELKLYFDLFNTKRMERITNISAKSLTSPGVPYFKKDVETQFDEKYGSKDKSIAAKTIPGNPVHGKDSGFDSATPTKKDGGFDSATPTKGVRKILRDIAFSKDVKFSDNYKDIQGIPYTHTPKSYILGYDKVDKGNLRIGYQKYTIQNPYAPREAGSLLFSIQNYAITESGGEDGVMFFPPYINSFHNSDSANWNSTNFLGRPEAVYTYNNSSRDGGISFYVLTDYAESVLLGRTQDANMDYIKIPINRNFTDISSYKQLVGSFLEGISKDSERDIKEKEKSKKENSTSNDSSAARGTDGEVKNGETSVTSSSDSKSGDSKEEEQADSSESSSTNKKFTNALNSAKEEAYRNSFKINYSESNNSVTNVYDYLMNEEKDGVDGYVESKPSDNVKRIKEMIKNLVFQPAYFSGNLVDFKKKMEFLAKLTRPAKNTINVSYNEATGTYKGSGFSFTRPPVCHLKLGDWFNHDIIVNSVSYDYTDAPWTLVEGKNQPMWASVTINFNIVGPAGASGGVPLTSTDKDGFFGNMSTYGK